MSHVDGCKCITCIFDRMQRELADSFGPPGTTTEVVHSTLTDVDKVTTTVTKTVTTTKRTR